MELLISIVRIIVIWAAAISFSWIFYFKIYRKYKFGTENADFETLMSVLNVIVHTEIDLYEKNIFDTKGGLTPQNFENYYDDIVHNIVKSLSSEFYTKMENYITKEAVVAYICRNVKEYLQTKVNGSI